MTHISAYPAARQELLSRAGRSAVLACLVMGCGGGGGAQEAAAPAPVPVRPIQPVRPLLTAAFAGQTIVVLPLTLVFAQDSMSEQPPFNAHAAALAWADSLIGAALESRGTEVKWVLPPALRKIARRSAGVVVDPDRMGQAVMRSPNLDMVPDPLRTSLRSLVALAGERFSLIPAALAFTPETDGRVRAELSLVLADARTGRVGWRTMATGFGSTPARALNAALEAVLPVGLGIR